jgi:hypothetical protein
MRSVHRARVWAVAAGIGVLGLGLPATAGATGVPVAPSSGLPGAPPVTPPTTSPVHSLGTVDAGTPVRDFGASLPPSSPIVNNPDPVVCAVGCWEYTFAVPRGSSAPVLVAVKSTKTGPEGTFNADQGFDLYLYGPDGKLAAGANGVGANGQSVEVTRPARGTYTVVVTYAYAYDTGSGFTGEVRLMAGPSWTPPPATCGIAVSGITGCFDLPRLQALPAFAFTASGIPPAPSSPLGFPLPLNLPLPTSCYADETVGLDNTQVTHLNNPALRCLRFTTDIVNVGAGPLTAQIPAAAEGSGGQPQVGYVPGDCGAYQLVSRPNGSVVSRPAGPCEFHVEHGHFHYNNLLLYALYQAGSGTTLGHQVGVSQKESFCLTDDDYVGFGSASTNGPRANVGQPDCNLPREANVPQAGKPGSGTFVTEGITPGWGDVYTWDTPDQYIDVTHVPSGTYDVVEETNPGGAILVAGPAQTCSITKIQLTVGSQSDSAQVLGSAGSIPCPAH